MCEHKIQDLIKMIIFNALSRILNEKKIFSETAQQ